jgi:hypothetical protein
LRAIDVTYLMNRGVGAMVLLMMAWPLSSVTQAQAVGPKLRLSPTVSPPGSRVTIAGKAFGSSEVVDITWDGNVLSKATTDPSGSFSKRTKTPKAAPPGDHTITATGETSGLSASAMFTVRTDWPMFHFDTSRSGLNPYENVLSASNVSQLTEKWTAPVPGHFSSTSAVAVVAGVVYLGTYREGFMPWTRARELSCGERPSATKD